MDSLGSSFQIEVNKFKFLNELVSDDSVFMTGWWPETQNLPQIRLVSKKFLGDKTPKEIQDRVSHLTS